MVDIILSIIFGLCIGIIIGVTNSPYIDHIRYGKLFKLTDSKYKCYQVEKLEYVKIRE